MGGSGVAVDNFESVSKDWAAAKLVSKGTLNGRTIRNVSFQQEHTYCIGHEADEYCYCDSSSWVEVWVYFTDKTAVQLFPDHEGRWQRDWELGEVIKELVDWR